MAPPITRARTPREAPGVGAPPAGRARALPPDYTTKALVGGHGLADGEAGRRGDHVGPSRVRHLFRPLPRAWFYRGWGPGGEGDLATGKITVTAGVVIGFSIVDG